MKICSKCKESKPFESFNKNKAQKDGYEYYCKICLKEIRKDKSAAYSKKYRLNNLELRILSDRLQSLKYRKAHPEKFAAANAKRRAVHKKATPKWINTKVVEDYYLRAKTWSKLSGEFWQVDHIVPLQSKLVCGLHCEQNLTILSKSVNVIKNNRYWPDMP
jgi:hypothetical protein